MPVFCHFYNLLPPQRLLFPVKTFQRPWNDVPSAAEHFFAARKNIVAVIYYHFSSLFSFIFVHFSFLFVPFSSVFVTFHLFSSLFHPFFIHFSSLFRHFFVISTTFTTISTTSTTNSATIKHSDKQSINYKSGGSGNKISKKILGMNDWCTYRWSPEKGDQHLTQGATTGLLTHCPFRTLSADKMAYTSRGNEKNGNSFHYLHFFLYLCSKFFVKRKLI